MPNSGKRLNTDSPTRLLDDHRALEPPDPIPNSEVKRRIADGSVGLPHVRVGHRQAYTPNPRPSMMAGGLSLWAGKGKWEFWPAWHCRYYGQLAKGVRHEQYLELA